MNNIPLKLRDELAEETRMKVCARRDEWNCAGRITWEHAWIYAKKQIQEKWAILGICEYHHLGKGMDKRKHEWLSLQLATTEDLSKYPRKDWKQARIYLAKLFK